MISRTRRTFFPDVHASFKFCILNFGGEQAATSQADFVFFAHRVEELEDRTRHIALSAADIRLLNPNTRTCPIFRSRRDAEITKAIYRRVPVLIDANREGPTGNPWGIQFKTMFHQTNDAELFREADTLKADGFKLKGNRWIKGKKVFLPVYEAKMLQDYDHRAADVVTDKSNWVRQGQTEKTIAGRLSKSRTLGDAAILGRCARSRDATECGGAFLCFQGHHEPNESANNDCGVDAARGVHQLSSVIVRQRTCRPCAKCCLLANLNSICLRLLHCGRKSATCTLNFFIVEQVPTLPPDTYDKPCPWDRRTTLETWISQRVLKLTCTAEDMLPLADACSFTGGSFQAEYGGRLNKWDEAERAELMAELDAAFFHLYGIARDDVEYILSTFKGIHDQQTLFPGASSIAERIVQKYAEMSFPA